MSTVVEGQGVITTWTPKLCKIKAVMDIILEFRAISVTYFLGSGRGYNGRENGNCYGIFGYL